MVFSHRLRDVPARRAQFSPAGLGSYLQTAASSDPGQYTRSAVGLAVLILIIVATDQLIWRPLVAWSDKFKFEEVESATRVTSPILSLFNGPASSPVGPRARGARWKRAFAHRLARTRECRIVQPIDDTTAKGRVAFSHSSWSFC